MSDPLVDPKNPASSITHQTGLDEVVGKHSPDDGPFIKYLNEIPIHHTR